MEVTITALARATMKIEHAKKEKPRQASPTGDKPLAVFIDNGVFVVLRNSLQRIF